MRRIIHEAVFLVLIAATIQPGYSQSVSDLQAYFQQDIGLSQDQIDAIRKGQPVAKTLPSRTPAADVNDQVNQLLQKTVLQGLIAYQREGNVALGAYNDKPDPAEVPKQFAYMLSYDRVLPKRLPDFYNYLLAYPNGKPANVEDTFYWARVKFGLKPTLRVVQVVTMHGKPGDQIAYAIAEKQLYSSHYFETALDLSFCVPGSDDPKQPGFYLIMVMGSEQTGLTGAKGSIVRKAAVGRSVSNLKEALTTIKNTLEGKH